MKCPECGEEMEATETLSDWVSPEEESGHGQATYTRYDCPDCGTSIVGDENDESYIL